MKRIIAISLVLTIVLTVFAIPVSAENAEVDTCFAVSADLHYEYQEEELEWYSEDPVFGYANRRAAMENESTYIIDEFLNQCAENDRIEFVLIAGDLANNGKRFLDQHIKVAEKLRRFEAESGKPVYIIDGNHDVGMVGEYCETGMTEFREVYYEFGYDEALATMEGNLSYTVDLNDKYRLIAADSCDYNRSTGDGMTEDRVEWVVEQAKLAVSEGKYPILMMHHNLLDHMPIQSVLSKDFIIRNHISTAEKFANAGIKLVFTGHEHCSDATTFTSSKGNLISDFATTSLTMYPLQYRIMEMSDATITYEAATIDSIDTENLRDDVIGYTDAHIEEMNKGMNAYAKKFLKNGVEYRLERGFEDEQLGIDKGAFYYDIVRNAVDELNGILNTPLYGEGSVQEMAKEKGIEIPDSEYIDGWDVATELVSAHYAGEENYPLLDRDVTILLRTMCFIIDSELYMITEDEFMAAAAAITALYGSTPPDKMAEKLEIDLGYSHGIQSFVLALASPLLDSFANDDDVPDNNGAIKGYAKTSSSENISNLSSSIQVTLEKLFERLAFILTFVFKGLDYIEM
ncbi:MAG: metallophosphoesterase [Clostridia bacterium]|nr:metallophosphoesterase [Clostridia bacterium]